MSDLQTFGAVVGILVGATIILTFVWVVGRDRYRWLIARAAREQAITAVLEAVPDMQATINRELKANDGHSIRDHITHLHDVSLKADAELRARVSAIEETQARRTADE